MLQFNTYNLYAIIWFHQLIIIYDSQLRVNTLSTNNLYIVIGC